MNETEALTLCRLAKSASPAQAMDEYTPQLWHEVLKDYRFEDCKTALIELAGEQEWLHVSHVVARVKKIRRARILAHGPIEFPAALSNDPDAEARWHKQAIERIADGLHLEPLAIDGPGSGSYVEMVELNSGELIATKTDRPRS